MPRSVRFPRHCGWNLIDADPIKQFPLIDSSCTANYVNGRCWQKWILSRFEDLLEEFRGELYSNKRYNCVKFFFGTGGGNGACASETNLLYSGIMMVDSNIEVTTVHIHAHKRAN